MIPLSTLDLCMLVFYLLLTAAIGVSFFRRRPSQKEFFLGGGRMGWLPVGISILAADLSAISVMGTPAWAYGHDISLLWVTIGYPIVAPLVIFLFAPFYSRLQLYTAYEYLERRFNLNVRIVTSLLFQLLRAWHVAVAIYGPSLVLRIVTGFPLWKCVLAMGLFTTIYTSLGGMKAVIWTDVMQFATVMTGVVLVLFLAIHGVPGGMKVAWHIASDAGRLRFVNTDRSLTETTTLWACLAGGIVLSLGPLTTDQAILQRLFATKSPKDFSRSVILQAMFIVPVIGLLYFVGAALFAFYRNHPDQLSGLPNVNAIVPWFVLTQLPHGIAGLVIASIFAASMAVMSAGVNALTTATTVDIYARVIRPDQSTQHYASAGRVGSFAWGAVVTLLALYAGHAGDLAVAYTHVSSVLVGPMLGIFLLGICTTRANAPGVLIGAVTAAVSVVALIALSPISFFYLGAVGTVVALVVGYLSSLPFAKPSAKNLHGLTLAHPIPYPCKSS